MTTPSTQVYDVSRLRIIPLTLHSASHESPHHKATNILTSSRRTRWEAHMSRTGARATLVLHLAKPTLLGFLRVHNVSTSCIDVSVAEDASVLDRYPAVGDTDRVRSGFVTVYRGRRLARNKTIVLRTGFMPCTVVRLQCWNRCEDPVRDLGVALAHVRALGVPQDCVRDEFGELFEDVLVHATKENLFRPQVKPRGSAVGLRTWERFPLQFTFAKEHIRTEKQQRKEERRLDRERAARLERWQKEKRVGAKSKRKKRRGKGRRRPGHSGPSAPQEWYELHFAGLLPKHVVKSHVTERVASWGAKMKRTIQSPRDDDE